MIGERLAHYEIVERIGSGGMGEVYRARDTKLERDVAIKLLPDEFAQDPDRLARFEREAKLLAALNHPNVAVIHGLEDADGIRFLALELVEGAGLDDLLRDGALAADQSLDIARQIARGLEAAHAKGIVHRDLKPANVRITPGGHVKVLDFGLAKMFGPDAAGAEAADITRSPTVAEGTRTGVVLGTAAYLSPEQARGDELDKRTDVWSFGCVLFEMLSGKRPFESGNASETIAAILRDEPHWEALSADVPPAAERALRRCLRKDPDSRIHDIADARIELESARDDPAGDPQGSPAVPAAGRIGSSERILWGTIALAAIVSAVAIYSGSREMGSSPAPVRRATITLPAGRTLPTDFTRGNPLALSPDGTSVVYTGIEDNSRRLYTRRLDSFDSVPIEGTEGAQSPFFSPDGEWLGFLADGWLKKVPVGGGVALPICEVGPRLLAATWTTSGTIVYSPDIATPLHEVDAGGGEGVAITILDRDAGIISHSFPQRIVGTDEVSFIVQHSDGFDAAILSLADGTWDTVVEGAIVTEYAPSGHLLYLTDDAEELRAVRVDLASRRAVGDHMAIAEGGWFDLSRDGTLAYMNEASFVLASAGGGDMVWVDRAGNERPLEGGENVSGHPKLSPGEERVVFEVGSAALDVYVLDLSTGGRSRVSQTGRINNFALWSPDGTEILFNSPRSPAGWYRKRWDDPGAARLAHTRAEGRVQLPASWSSQHGTIAYTEIHPETGDDIWHVAADGSRAPEALIVSPYSEEVPTISPDGTRIAYLSDETGTREVYVASYPDVSGKTAVSSGGATGPRWSKDGDELYFVSGDRMMSVSIGDGPGIGAGRPEELFRGDYAIDDTFQAAQYDVTRDGRFLMVKPYEAPAGPVSFNIVFNFLEELERISPANR